jgi:acyl-coenzyme A synthetase/AMP-(fatty) acid ligase
MAVGLIRAVIDAAIADPQRPAVFEVDHGIEVSRAAMLHEASRLAEMLDATTPENATVMLHGPGGAAYWAGLLAVFGTGRRLLPVGIETVAADRAALADAHRVAAVIETSADATWSDPPSDAVVIPVAFGTADDSEVEAATARLDRAATASLLLRSSGTTGRPGVALREAAALDRVSQTLVEVLGLRDDDRVLATLPMQHAYGIEHGVMAPMRAGATVAFKAGFDLMAGAEALLDGTTVFPAVPVTLEAATRVARPDHTLRLAYTAGSPLPESVRSAFEAAWKVRVGDLYGMTEVGTITWGFGDDRRAVPGVSIGVVDPEAEDATATIRSHGAGEIVVRSDAMSTGYLAEAGARPDPGRRIDGHLRTGDLGEIDESGRLRITGRAKLQFDVGGLKVNPEEVEAVLLTIEQIREVAVVPVALSETVTRVMAVVVLDPAMNIGPAGIDIAIRVRSRNHLAPHQRPRIVQIVKELPRSATGKLLRGRLIDAFTAPDE